MRHLELSIGCLLFLSKIVTMILFDFFFVKYYMPLVEINNFNQLIDNNFF